MGYLADRNTINDSWTNSLTIEAKSKGQERNPSHKYKEPPSAHLVLVIFLATPPMVAEAAVEVVNNYTVSGGGGEHHKIEQNW